MASGEDRRGYTPSVKPVTTTVKPTTTKVKGKTDTSSVNTVPVVKNPVSTGTPATGGVKTPTPGATAVGAYTKENFPYAEYIKANPSIQQGGKVDQHEYDRAWADFVKKGGTWKAPAVTPPKPTTPTTPTTPKPTTPATVVPGNAVPGTGQINVADYGGQVALDPSKALTLDNPKTTNVNEDMNLSNRVPNINENAAGTNIDPNASKYQMDTDKLNQTAATGGQAAQAALTDPRNAATYQAQTTQQNIAQNGQMTAAQGQVSEGAIIDPNEVPQLDMKGTATGVNEDGSINYTGQALNEYASQNISNIIDTSTPAGKALAEQLGEGNYTDSKATLKGQLDILQSEFQNPDGTPKIPMWAAATARNVSKIASFSGMTGTAATAAMAQALMEASIPIAQQDAQFFQTVTLQNLSNKQASILNKANVLAKFDLTNLDNRMAAAVENSKAFLQMDMANLDNRQQAEVINTQARVQSILEDAKAINAQRLFTAESQNDMNKFYDELNANIKQFNATQTNNMKQFNASETNSMTKFNAEMENNREQFYKNMQYNIDVSNAKWRQTVTLTESQMAFDAAATDVKNMVGISNEQLNRLWDRSDSLLDYLWKSTESELDRKQALAITKLQGKMQLDAQDKAGFGSILGSITGAIAGSDQFLDFLF